MNQEQPRRPHEYFPQQEPIKYGDVFQVSGDLADKPIAPQDANLMQQAEATVLGQTQIGGPATVMQAAATVNERAGLVGRGDVTDVAGDVTLTATDYPGTRVVTESVGGQVVGQYYQYVGMQETTVVGTPAQTRITIGEALEAKARAAGDKPVDQSDAAAIAAAEVRATGTNVLTPGGVAAAAQSAAAFNVGLDRDADKIKLSDVLTDATAKLPADKPVTRDDAEGVITAEMRNNPDLSTKPAGVGASVAAAAKLNEGAT